ncbi:MAG TPA: hypothetical protein PK728_01655 [Bacillota bacterium]|nr:hypothetical protein [Bacillota bacterium]
MFISIGNMLENPKRITIFTGHFGSGKTEIALNYALNVKLKGRKTAIADLDIINPYFRTRTVKKLFEKNGIKVISPPGRLAAADVPALPPAVIGLLEDAECYAVFDTGGYDVGAVVLSRFKEYLPDGAFNLFLVVNTCRLSTGDPEGIAAAVRTIENASRIKVSALVSNVHLGCETEPGIILKGHAVVAEASERLGLPVGFMCVREDLAAATEEAGIPVLPLRLFIKPPWHEDIPIPAGD